MFEDGEVPRDLVSLVVPQRGGLVATGERQEPFRLVDGDGLVVAAAAVFFCDLQAAGRTRVVRRCEEWRRSVSGTASRWACSLMR
jgi:hypothetical protein